MSRKETSSTTGLTQDRNVLRPIPHQSGVLPSEIVVRADQPSVSDTGLKRRREIGGDIECFLAVLRCSNEENCEPRVQRDWPRSHPRRADANPTSERSRHRRARRIVPLPTARTLCCRISSDAAPRRPSSGHGSTGRERTRLVHLQALVTAEFADEHRGDEREADSDVLIGVKCRGRAHEAKTAGRCEQRASPMLVGKIADRTVESTAHGI